MSPCCLTILPGGLSVVVSVNSAETEYPTTVAVTVKVPGLRLAVGIAVVATPVALEVTTVYKLALKVHP